MHLAPRGPLLLAGLRLPEAPLGDGRRTPGRRPGSLHESREPGSRSSIASAEFAAPPSSSTPVPCTVSEISAGSRPQVTHELLAV